MEDIRCTDIKLHNFSDLNPNTHCSWCGLTVSDVKNINHEKIRIIKFINWIKDKFNRGYGVICMVIEDIKPSIHNESIHNIKKVIEKIEKHQKEQFTSKEIINLLSSMCVLLRQKADLLQELATQVHYVEDCKWRLNHLIKLYEENISK